MKKCVYILALFSAFMFTDFAFAMETKKMATEEIGKKEDVWVSIDIKTGPNESTALIKSKKLKNTKSGNIQEEKDNMGCFCCFECFSWFKKIFCSCKNCCHK